MVWQKILSALIALFGYMHAVRDYLQTKNVWNWFTTVGHFWHAPQYEKYSIVVSIGIGVAGTVWFFSLIKK